MSIDFTPEKISLNLNKQKACCNGTYYNFKKGTEFCAKRTECIFFKSNALNVLDDKRIDQIFNRIYQFRNCALYKEKK